MVKYAPLSAKQATSWIDFAKDVIAHYGDDHLGAWGYFNRKSAGVMSRDDKSLIFRYAGILVKGKRLPNGRFIEPGDKRAAMNYVKRQLGRKIAHDEKGPQRASKLKKHRIGTFSGAAAASAYHAEQKKIIKEKMGSRYMGGKKKKTKAPPKVTKRKAKRTITKGDLYGDGYDGEGFSESDEEGGGFDDRMMEMYQKPRHALRGGYFGKFEECEEYVGRGYGDSDSDEDEDYDSVSDSDLFA